MGDPEKKKKAEGGDAADGKPKEKKPRPEGAKGEKGGKDKGKEKGKDKGKEAAPAAPRRMSVAKVPSRLKERLRQEILPKLGKRLGYDNPMAMPRLDKIVVSMGLGISKEKDSKLRQEEAIRDLTVITGQKPRLAPSRKSVAGFNLRAGLIVGLHVTMRGSRMYDFFDRLVSVAIPRIRDFTGLPRRGFDQAGNYSMGVREQGIFPEVDVNKVQMTQGMNITIGIKSRKREDAMALLEELGLPLAKE